MNDQWGYKVTLAVSGDGYTIKTPCSEKGGKNYLTSKLWSDGLAAAWTFTPVTVEGYTNVYEISINNTYLTGASTKKVTTESAANGNNSYWLLLSKDQLVANFKNATETNPVDATFLLTNPEFQRHFDGEASAWPHTNEGGNVTVVGDGLNSKKISYDQYYGCEFWNNTFDIHQTVTGLPAGKYKVSVDGFGTNGTTYIYANDASSTFAVTDPGTKSLHEALANIAAGKYERTYSPVVTITDGNLTCGIKRETNKGTDWAAFDNFYLYYVGQISSTEIKDAYTTAVTTAKETANKTDKMSQTAKTALTEAINDYGALDASSADDDALKSATENLNKAVTNVNSSIAAYAHAKTVLTNREALLATTNFYTADAYDTYYTKVKTAYDAGTLADADASALEDPSTVTGYQAAKQTPAFLGSVTGVTGYDGNVPYVNTWSKEGLSDGSNFTVPYYEYFASDANQNGTKSLSDATLTFTKTGLEAGTYKVTLWARAQMTYGKTDNAITGITMNVNGGTSKTFAGPALGKNSFYLENETLYGTVGTDGTLKLNVVVAGTNSSWLSIKNVKYEKVEDMTIDETKNYDATTGEYNVTVNRTLKKNVWNSLVLPFALTNDQVTTLFGTDAKVAAFSNTSDNTVDFNTTTDGIKANIPAMLYVTKDVTNFNPGVVTLEAGTPESVGKNWTLAGNYTASYALKEGEYMLSGSKWWKNESGDGYNVKGMRAYLKANTASAAKLASVRMVIDGTTTAINGINSNVNVNNDNKMYNLAGQRVNNNYKGVVIVNGKKVILK